MADSPLDELVNHRIGIERLGLGMLRRLVPALEEARRDVVDIIRRRIFTEGSDGGAASSRRGPSRTRVVQLEAALNTIRRAQLEAYSAMARQLLGELQGLAVLERDWANSFYGSFFGVSTGDLTLPSADMLVAAALETPMSGRTVESWASRMTREHIAETERQIRLGVMQGESTDQMVARLLGTDAFQNAGLFPRQDRAASTLVRTGVNHISNAAHAQFIRGNARVLREYQWISVLDNRCVDGLTLVWTADGSRPIAEIEAGDVVYGGSGRLLPVRSIIRKRVKGACRVTFSNGETVLCSRDHFFLRDDQKWVEAQELRPGNGLACRQKVSGDLKFNRQPIDEMLELRGRCSEANDRQA